MKTGGRPILVLFRSRRTTAAAEAAACETLAGLQHALHPREVVYHNVERGPLRPASWFRFDAVLLHASFLELRRSPTFSRSKWRMRWIADLSGRKIALPHDEFDHAHVLDEWLCELGVDTVFTDVPADRRGEIYPFLSQRAHFVPCLGGFDLAAAVEATALRPSPTSRPVDVIFAPPSAAPEQNSERSTAADRALGAFSHRARTFDLRTDAALRRAGPISLNERLARIAAAKVMVDLEPAAGLLDRRGEVAAYRTWQAALVAGSQASLKRSLLDTEPPPTHCAAVAARHLEAIASKTVLVLPEGQYAGLLEPHRHYLPLQADLGNLAEVVATLRDPRQLEAVAERAYAAVVAERHVAETSAVAQLQAEIQSSMLPQRSSDAITTTFAEWVCRLNSAGRAQFDGIDARTGSRRRGRSMLFGFMRLLRRSGAARTAFKAALFSIRLGRLPRLLAAARDIARLSVLHDYVAACGDRLSTTVRYEPTPAGLRLVLTTCEASGWTDGARLESVPTICRSGGDLHETIHEIVWQRKSAHDLEPYRFTNVDGLGCMIGPDLRYNLDGLVTLARSSPSAAQQLWEFALHPCCVVSSAPAFRLQVA
jgi:hypothetical protein